MLDFFKLEIFRWPARPTNANLRCAVTVVFTTMSSQCHLLISLVIDMFCRWLAASAMLVAFGSEQALCRRAHVVFIAASEIR